jgi:hypothetical protein
MVLGDVEHDRAARIAGQSMPPSGDCSKAVMTILGLACDPFVSG